MKKSLFSYALIAAAFLCLLFPSLVAANPSPIIQFQSTNLADTTPGQDLWEYTYTLSYDPASSGVFMQDQGFAIYFDVNNYGVLQDPPPALLEWSTFVFQPNIGMPLDGEYDALALVNPSIPSSFNLTFEWLGGAGTTPGAQPFNLYQYDTNGDVLYHFDDHGNLIDDSSYTGEPPFSGRTIASNATIPEPATCVLLASGLIMGALLYRKRK
jgi:hypothetical protein